MRTQTTARKLDEEALSDIVRHPLQTKWLAFQKRRQQQTLVADLRATIWSMRGHLEQGDCEHSVTAPLFTALLEQLTLLDQLENSF